MLVLAARILGRPCKCDQQTICSQPEPGYRNSKCSWQRLVDMKVARHEASTKLCLLLCFVLSAHRVVPLQTGPAGWCSLHHDAPRCCHCRPLHPLPHHWATLAQLLWAAGYAPRCSTGVPPGRQVEGKVRSSQGTIAQHAHSDAAAYLHEQSHLKVAVRQCTSRQIRYLLVACLVLAGLVVRVDAAALAAALHHTDATGSP
jgi:hypothetical protein